MFEEMLVILIGIFCVLIFIIYNMLKIAIIIGLVLIVNELIHKYKNNKGENEDYE